MHLECTCEGLSSGALGYQPAGLESELSLLFAVTAAKLRIPSVSGRIRPGPTQLPAIAPSAIPQVGCPARTTRRWGWTFTPRSVKYPPEETSPEPPWLQDTTAQMMARLKSHFRHLELSDKRHTRGSRHVAPRQCRLKRLLERLPLSASELPLMSRLVYHQSCRGSKHTMGIPEPQPRESTIPTELQERKTPCCT